MNLRVAGGVFALSMGSARAEEPSFTLDVSTIVVAPFDAAVPSLRPDAERVRAIVEDRLAGGHLVIQLADVPAFAAYGADVYVRSCPAGRYVDCVFVVGQRGGADWVVGGTLRAVEGGFATDLVILDVRTGALVLELEVGFDGFDDAATADTLVPVFDQVVAGAFAATDVRASAEGVPVPEQLERADLIAAADELDAMEAEEGAVSRDTRETGTIVKVTGADVRRYRTGEAEPPWSAVQLSPLSWQRWRNSGRTLVEHRSRARGRQGEILVGLQLIGIGSGPWGQDWDLWFARDPRTLQITEQYSQMDISPGLSRAWELSLGAGILPWLDLAVVGGVRLVPWRWNLRRLTIGDVERPPETGERLETAPVVGGRITFAPMPAFPARPIVQLGVLHAWGTPSSRVIATPEEIQTLPAVRWLLAQVNAGVEVSVGKALLLWARAEVEIPLGRYVPDPLLRGGAALEGHPTPNTADESIAVGGALGATIRLRVRPKGR